MEQKKVTLNRGEKVWKLSAEDLQLIADALAVVSPDSADAHVRAGELAALFALLAE